MIADHINDLIVAAKALPNGLNRNKMVSHLEDAKAHAMVLEGYGDPRAAFDNLGASSKQVAGDLDALKHRIIPCICPAYPHAQALDCPVHKAG
jgi:hypothetical protein